MRPRVHWMTETDDAVLEFLDSLGTPDDKPVAMNPTLVHRNIVSIRGKIDKSDRTIARRMSVLNDAGLLEKEGEQGAHYILTDKGRAYLRGDLDADDLERDGD